MELAGVKPGMSVADVGAGEGYYTVRLAPRRRAAGAGCWPRTSCPRRPRPAQRSASSASGSTMSRSSSARPTIRCFPPRSFDRVFLVHMYHEVQSPYAFLWHLRDGVKPDGLVIVVDADRPVKQPRHAAGAAEVRIRRAWAWSRSSSAC